MRPLLLLLTLVGLLAGCTDANCISAICGCWEPRVVDLEITLIDEAGDPVAGITATCLNEDSPIATSDSAGLLQRSFETRVSEGCGTERCSTLTLSDPQGLCIGIQTSIAAINFSSVRLRCGAPGDDDDSAN